ncbi:MULTISPECIES: hypothetical protein [unclassified Streptomyces]|uniref:hypothetical protein n=1 Tax=unclassified Streptomyces TaxID=2593676 RepID=UPI00278BB982|nr:MULTISPECIES: hypothetical protein [unclassified Streptomyces]
MRLRPRFTAALALLISLPYVAACAPAQDATAGKGGHARVAEKKRERAECRIEVDRFLVTATCHNPNPTVDRVALHIECAQWWDIDTDSRPKPVFPAETLRMDGRCWKNVQSAWVSHQKPAR